MVHLPMKLNMRNITSIQRAEGLNNVAITLSSQLIIDKVYEFESTSIDMIIFMLLVKYSSIRIEMASKILSVATTSEISKICPE